MEFEWVKQEELADVSRACLNRYGEGIYVFHGDLGAGKTALIRTLCEQIGVMDQPSSPTFSIINEYHSNSGRVVVHMDLYRVDHEDELWSMGVEEVLFMGDYVFIEWPEKIQNFLPDGVVRVDIVVVDEFTRSIKFSFRDDQF